MWGCLNLHKHFDLFGLDSFNVCVGSGGAHSPAQHSTLLRCLNRHGVGFLGHSSAALLHKTLNILKRKLEFGPSTERIIRMQVSDIEFPLTCGQPKSDVTVPSFSPEGNEVND